MPVETLASGLADREANANGSNPFTVSQMPADNSQKNSGIIAMAAHTEI